MESGRELRTLEGHSDYVHGVALSADGRGGLRSADKTLKVWDVDSGRELITSLPTAMPCTASLGARTADAFFPLETTESSKSMPWTLTS